MGYVESLREYVGHKLILSAGVLLFVFNRQGQVLMQFRTDFEKWGFPGGSMELGESFEDTATRELKEETNLEVRQMKLLKVLSGKGTYREYPNGDKLYDITAIYVITNYAGDLRINNSESSKLGWFGIENLPNNIAPHTKNYLEKFGSNLLQEAVSLWREC